jgi:Ca-activated chloride channel family protein
MKCEQINEYLTAFLLGDLDEATRQAVEKHLEQCEGCRAQRRELKLTLDLVREALSASSSPAAIPQRLTPDRRACVTSASPARRPVRVMRWFSMPHPRFALAAAACLVLAFVIAGLMLPGASKAREKAMGAKLCLGGPVSEAPPSLSVAPARKTQDWGGGVPADSLSVAQATDADGVATRERQPVNVVRSPELTERKEATREVGDSTATIVYKADLDEGRRSAGKMGAGGAVVAGAPKPKARGDGDDMVFDLAPAPAPVTTPPPPPPAPAASALMKRHEALDGVAGGELRAKAGENGKTAASRTATEEPPPLQARLDYRQEPAASIAPTAESAPQPARMGSGGGRLLSVNGEPQAAPAQDGEASHKLKEGEDNLRRRNYGEKGAFSGSSVTPQGAAIARGKQAADAGMADQPEEQKAGIPIVGRLFYSKTKPSRPSVSDKSYVKDERGLEKDLAQARNVTGTDSNRKFDDGKKEGDRSEDRKAPAEPPGKGETTALFGKCLSMIPVAEPRELPAKFRAFGVNQFIEAASQPFSTFSIDVDTASYTVSRNYMLRGQRPPAEAVRTEEFVNFFDYAYAAPTRETFRIYADVAPSQFGRGMHMLKIGIKGKRLGREEERGAVLTFLVDTSGSMDKPDRIALIRKSLKMLLGKLGPHDQVAVVQFDSSARLALDHTPASERDRIGAVIDSLQCSGSTHLEGGMTLAYQTAARSFKADAENRVLILSDGVANLGTMAAEDILSKVEAYRKQGIYCSVFGFGIGTFDDTMLETLANKGNGTYAFIDSDAEAKRVFVDDLAATLNTIASDVKIQVEFNPKRVAKYRQLGYENRQLKKEDFRNDALDAGEVGSGQSVTALYEAELRDGRDVLAVVRLRYRRVDNGRVEEIERTVTSADVRSEFEKADARFRLAACVAEFSEQLRGSPHAAGAQFEDVAAALRPVALELSLDMRVQELLRLVGAAGSLSLNAQ